MILKYATDHCAETRNGLPVGWALVGTHVDDGLGLASSQRVADHVIAALRGESSARSPTATVTQDHPPGYPVKMSMVERCKSRVVSDAWSATAISTSWSRRSDRSCRAMRRPIAIVIMSDGGFGKVVNLVRILQVNHCNHCQEVVTPVAKDNALRSIVRDAQVLLCIIVRL